jgi:hypothetical protein
MTPTTNQYGALDTSDSDESTDLSDPHTSKKAKKDTISTTGSRERPTRKKRFVGTPERERKLLQNLCSDAISDKQSLFRKQILTPRMVKTVKTSLQSKDITDDELRKIATRVISSDYIEAHPDHPSDLIYQPSVLSQYDEKQPSASQEQIYTPARATTTTQISTLKNSPPTPASDTTVQNLAESFDTPQIVAQSLDMQVTETLATTGQEYIDARIKQAINTYIQSEETQDNIRDTTNQHMKQFLDIEANLNEQKSNISHQLTDLQESLTEGVKLLAELKHTNTVLQDENQKLTEKGLTIVQETATALDRASAKMIKTTEEQIDLFVTRNLATMEKSSQTELRKITRATTAKFKAKTQEQITAYDKDLAEKYDDMVVKGNGLIYEMGNTIQTELDLVLDESSSKIKEIKTSAAMDEIIAHAKSKLDMTLNTAPERIDKLEQTQREHQTQLVSTRIRQQQGLARITTLEENISDTPPEPAQLDAPDIAARIQSGINAATVDISNQMQILKHGISTLNHTLDNSILHTTQDVTMKIDHTMTTIKALLVVRDNEIIEMRKTYDEHIDNLTARLHTAYTQEPGTTPDDGVYHGQYEHYDQPDNQPDEYKPQSTPSQRRTSDATSLLSPRAIGLNDSRVDLGFHNFKRDTWAHRLSDEPTRQEMEQLYDIIVSSCRAYGIPILKREDLLPRGTVYPLPEGISGPVHDRISMLMYRKLLETIPHECKSLHSILASFSSQQDGYSALFAIMRSKCSYLQDIQPLWGPTWTAELSPYSYLTALNSKLEEERRRYHNRTSFDIAAEILQQASQHEEYKLLATAYLTNLLPLVSQDKNKVVPKEYQKENLINSLSSYYRTNIAPASTNTPFSINRMGGGNPGGREKAPFKYKNEVQCTACKMFGHDIKLNVCRFCAQHYHTSKYTEKNPEEAIKNASAFASSQDKAKLNKAKLNFPNLFHPDMNEADEMEALAHIALVMYPDADIAE